MKQSLSWEADSFLTGRKASCPLCDLKFKYRVHKDTTGFCSKPDEFNQHPQILFLYDLF
jgi:uncharacterized Zn-finger protein